MTGRRLWQLQHRAAPYLFVAPFVLLFAAFMLWPMLSSLWLTLHKTAGPRQVEFAGLHHFRFVLRDSLFWLALLNTVAFTVLFLLVQIPASLGLALLLNRRGVRFRFAFFSSHLVGQSFVAVLFYLMLAPRQGLVNRFIGAVFPSVGDELNWRQDPGLAMPALVLAYLWLNVGFGMIYFLAALQSVDPELYAAAEVDGAGRWARFRHVTLPGIRPVLLFLVVVGTVGGIQLFELPYVFFQGPGPGFRGITVVMYLYQYGFERMELGYAAAIGWMLFLFGLAATLLQIRLSRVARE
jgi:ABC-type sugar transport system permease subunit